MKKILLTTTVFLIVFVSIAQEKSRKEIRAEKEAIQTENIKKLIDSKEYVLNVAQAFPMTGGTVFLDPYDFDLTILGDTAIAYLPFYGISYNFRYGAGNEIGIKFQDAISDYKIKKGKRNNIIKMEVKTPDDTYNMTLSVSKLGYADLSVSCSRKQTIKYTGYLCPIERPIAKNL
ncbi:MAG: DUF4251 domain-containing protein [Prolixibacteraceae bacterium]|nr:DUF4251 domain-containing protein [Prolixibacteraceae bacterium]MBN2773973.1 DUF4251 domain-containing protein [Prolixibacteraceae bacterium]